MSLKAKIEAIIYAAEEPVTLAQLFGLLGQEAAAELDDRAAQQTALFAEVPPTGTLTPQAELQPAPAPDPSGDPNPSADPNPELETETEANPAPSPETAQADTANPTLSPDDKLLQRQARDRERAVRDLLREHLDQLVRDYRDGDRGLEIREVASGFRLATRPEYHDAVRGFARSLKPPLKLSLQALETLAVVAYKQPVTAPEVAEIRGVDSAGVLGSLAARKLVTTAGRKAVVGRPILYKTTKEFLLRFGLRDVNELPSIEEFERLAGELADTEPQQEEIPMPEPSSAEAITAANLQGEADSTEPQADGSGATEAEIGIPVDGRISGPPPTQDFTVDSSAGDAAIQADQQTDEQSSSYAAENGTED